jgi:hypothetical protein
MLIYGLAFNMRVESQVNNSKSEIIIINSLFIQFICRIIFRICRVKVVSKDAG